MNLLFRTTCAIGLLTACVAKPAAAEGTIVYPQLLQGRGFDGPKVVRVTDELVLNLEPSSVFTDVFLVQTVHGGNIRERYYHADQFEKNLYHDPNKMASVMVTETNDVQIEGVVGPGLRIKPLLGMERSIHGDMAHVLDAVQQQTDTTVHDYGFAPGSNNSSINSSFSGPGIRSTTIQPVEERRLPTVILPEVHIVVQYDHAKAFDFDEEKITRYFAVFVNVVNLKFRSMKDPKVQIRVAGITINKQRSDEEYVLQHHTFKEFMSIMETMESFMEHFRKQPLYNYVDIIYLVNGLDMVLGDGPGMMTETNGYTYVGGACTDYKFAQSEDTPLSYVGAQMFAHEIAHLLGCVHDGEPEDPWIPGNPGAKSCPFEDGYLMSFIVNDTKHNTFSNCSMQQMRQFFQIPDRYCLQRQDAIHFTLNRSHILPGSKIGAEKFCQLLHGKDFPHTYWDTDHPINGCTLGCVILRDKRKLPPKRVTHFALDGSPCSASDPNMICLNGKCRHKELWEKTFRGRRQG